MKGMEGHSNSDINDHGNEADSVSDGTKTVSTDVLSFASTLKHDGIMETIVNYLDYQDLDRWIESCQAFELHDMKDLDRICWKQRAKKLAAAVRMKTPLEEKWPKTPYREIFYTLRNMVDSLIEKTRGLFANRWNKPSLEEITDAAPLAYYGLLGP